MRRLDSFALLSPCPLSRWYDAANRMKHSERLAPWVGLTAVGVFLHLRELSGSHVFFRDSHAMFVPGKHFLWETLRAGEFPHWYPYDGGGTPFIPQSLYSVFHPTTALYLFLPFWTAFALQDLSGTLAGLFGIYLLARELGQPRLAAFLAAATFGACGYVVCTNEFTFTKLSAGALPWFAWGLLIAERRGGRWHVAAPLAMALVLLGGEPQVAMMAAGVGGVLLFGAGASWEERSRRRWLGVSSQPANSSRASE